jgi:hypothetical protein
MRLLGTLVLALVCVVAGSLAVDAVIAFAPMYYRAPVLVGLVAVMMVGQVGRRGGGSPGPGT